MIRIFQKLSIIHKFRSFFHKLFRFRTFYDIIVIVYVNDFLIIKFNIDDIIALKK